MTDLALRTAARNFQASLPVSDVELDALVALTHDTIYALRILGGHPVTVRELQTDLKRLERLACARDLDATRPAYLISA